MSVLEMREAAHPDQQLVDYLARRYAAAGRQADVLGLCRDRFLAERTLTNYQALREAATASGVVLIDALIDDHLMRILNQNGL